MSEESEAILVLAHAVTRIAVAMEGRPQQAQQQQPQQDFTPLPDPDDPGGACPEHGTAWRMVPSGTSKKPPYKKYNAFWTCSTQGCNIKPGQIVESLAF